MSIQPQSKVSKVCVYPLSITSIKRLMSLRQKSLSSYIYSGLMFFVLIALMFFITSSLYAAPQTIPGEDKAGLFYAITHLHPVAYIVLFCLFCLSMLNLYYQGWISSGSIRLAILPGLRKLKDLTRTEAASPSYPQTQVGDTGPTSRVLHKSKDKKENIVAAEEGVVATRRAINQARSAFTSKMTPLDGLNHPLPNFNIIQSSLVPTQQSKVTGKKSRFKFSAAVDLPSPEEMEQRSRQRLIVTGTVKGPDAKGLPSVLVFLTDEHGNRLGQSARSMADTGEFKVQANEPGRYLLNAYKRGYVMEASKPIELNRESGRIEGIRIQMRPEGCLVHGRVIIRNETVSIDEIEVICIIQNESVPMSTRLSSGGVFRISGVPHDSTCYIEVLKTDGTIVARTEVFNTEKNKDVYREIILSGENSDKNNPMDNPSNPAEWAGTGREGEEGSSLFFTAPLDQH